ncbi:hypothetical protein D9M68_402130 [compost metagenome]
MNLNVRQLNKAPEQRFFILQAEIAEARGRIFGIHLFPCGVVDATDGGDESVNMHK